MPVHTEILRWRKKWASGENFAIFKKRRYRDFRLWLRNEGKHTYLEYLATHPSYVVESLSDARPHLFEHRFEPYTGKAPTRSFVVRAADWVFPLFPPSLALLIAVFASAWSVRRRLGPAILVFGFIVALSLLNAAIIFHLDAMEVPRHCALGIPLLQACSYILLILLFEKRFRFSVPDQG